MAATNKFTEQSKQVFNPWRKKEGAPTKYGNYAGHFRHNFATFYGKADYTAKKNILKLLVGPYLACADALRVGGLTAALISDNKSHVGLLDYFLNPLGMLSLACIRLSKVWSDAKFEKVKKPVAALLGVAWYAFNLLIRAPLAIAATLTSLVTHLVKAVVAFVAAAVGSVATLAAEKIADRKVQHTAV